MITIVIVDDYWKSLRTISSLLKNEDWLQIIAEMSNGYDLISYCHNTHINLLPNIVLVDVNMLKMDGIAVTDYLTDYFPTIKVIGVSAYTERETVEDMFSAGAWGYVTKINLTCLPTAILNVGNNLVFIDPTTNVDGFIREDSLAQRKERKAQAVELHLTKRECMFVALNASGLEYSEIAKLMFIERKTVDNIFANVSKKLSVSNRHNLTIFSIRTGLTLIARLKCSKNKDV